jgi:hypothetical protein
VIDDARYLRHLAQLHHALALADVESASPDPAAAGQVLARLAAEPWDPAVGLARIASASMQIASNPADARRALHTALAEWKRRQISPPGAQTLDGVAEDVAELRRIAFRPAGGDPYTRERRWEAFPLPHRPFLVVNPEVPVGFADGTEIAVSVFRADADVQNVLFMNAEQIALLAKIAEKLGGTRTRAPEAIMEVPNQPIGGARAIVSLWSELFEAHPGHWGGWIFETAPVISRIDFLDAGRTKAAVKVTLRYEGVTVVLEKRESAWRVVRLTHRWIT